MKVTHLTNRGVSTPLLSIQLILMLLQIEIIVDLKLFTMDIKVVGVVISSTTIVEDAH